MTHTLIRESLPAILLALLLCTPVRGFEATADPDAAGEAAQNGAQDAQEGPRLFTEGVVERFRNNAGFVLSALGLYDNNSYRTESGKASATAFYAFPRVFANVDKQRHRLHFEYGFGYRYYWKNHDLNASQHEGHASYTYDISRRTRVGLNDLARRGPNDMLAYTGGIRNQLLNQVDGAQQVFFDNRYRTSNHLALRLAHDFSRNNQFQVSGFHDLYRYDEFPGENTMRAGFRMNDRWQATRNFFLTASGEQNWIDSANGLRDGMISRISLGLGLGSLYGWRIHGSYGVERTRTAGAGARVRGIVGGEIGHRNPTNEFQIDYRHQSYYQLGLPGLNRMDSARAIFTQLLGRRVILHLASTYYRTYRPDLIETVGSNAGFNFMIRHDLVAMLGGNYLYQKRHGATPLQILDQDRYAVMLGLQYVLPSIHSRRNGSAAMP